MQGSDGQLHVLLVDQDRDLDFGGGNHLDIDALFRQGAEHLRRDAYMAAHANANDRYFGYFCITNDLAGTKMLLYFTINDFQ